ncbi:MAG: YbjN domain-containing protein [Microscillaceae bacterium]|nr:YbjN domain-containing protein [Microscillaceae bacterium]
MPKFNVLKDGVNEALIAATQEKVEKYMGELFHDYEIVKIDDFYTFTFGTITVTVQVLPWHSEDVLVKVYSYLGDEDSEVTVDTRDELMRLNANIPFGSFGVTFEGQPIFTYSLAGKNLDLNEFQAAVQMVAKTADEYDELIKGEEVATS